MNKGCTIVVVLLPALAFGYAAGPPDAMTGAPSQGTCHACHADFPLNGGPGSLSLQVPPTFVPGSSYTIAVRVEHPGQTRWGFEFSPLTHGTCTITNPDSTQLSITGGIPYVKQTLAGTNAGSPGPMVWSFVWTAPEAAPDTVFFYAAGNAANNNNRSTGDYIYTAVAWSVLQDVIPPNGITDLVATPIGTDLVLTWSNPGDNVGVVDYLVYVSPVPYFSPTIPFAIVAGPTFTIPNGVGDPSIHHFVNVRARDAALNLGPPSNVVGEFEFLLN